MKIVMERVDPLVGHIEHRWQQRRIAATNEHQLIEMNVALDS